MRKPTTEIRIGDRINLGSEIVTVFAIKHDAWNETVALKIDGGEIVMFNDWEDLEVV